ncbi:FctA domain-containing protein [Collinsella aerofaciens]|uniref:Spy0128 family protein n=1 Tax=Collinsella aerofaciens TaxID=74426 RepID=UPI00189F3D4F|nr:FctA domain-containing protein [Collinsella aerofaciens]MDB1859088.1 FctA domain-containing protein [Collinsella aerofaciens]
MKANSDKSKQSNKATRRVLAGVLCGASVLSLVLSLVMPPISQAIANDAQTDSTEKTVMGGGSSSESTDVGNINNGDTENQNSDEVKGDETSGDAASEAVPLSDDTEADGAAQPADDGEPVYKVATIANEGEAQGLKKDADDYTLLKSDDDLSTYLDMENKPEKLRLAADISSSTSITISQNTTIDLAGHKLYYRTGNNDTFITVMSGALTIEDNIEDNTAQVSDAPSVVANDPGQLAIIKWTGDKNDTPQSLTYYETTSTPNEDALGTTETTTQHVVSGFGAIVGASEGGSVQQVISVEDGGTLNLNGGMITTPRTLGNNGHVILSQGTVNISGGYVTNGNGGGWGGGLCVTGANAKFNMTGGVIAANKAASGGGIYADNGAKLNLSGGVISGNATYGKPYDNLYSPDNGYGGGVFTKNADVTISGTANITNNRVDSYITTSYNNGLLGGGGIASVNDGKLTMTGGSVTANYSHEAGGGVYAGFWNQAITFKMTGGTIAGNKSDNAEGGGLRISENTTGFIEAASASSKVYITNNKTMTGSTTGRGGDWGGGGVFVQTAGTLNLRAALVTRNEAGGWGGGIGACPTGQTIVTHTNGSAIYSNTDHGENFSAGGNGKNEDSQSKYITGTFKDAGHQDFFLVRNKDNASSTIAVVLGKMLGGESAGWQGTCDGNPITIDPNGGAEAKYMFGLEAHPTDEAMRKAQIAATTIISGNYSYTHGGGIMTNGDLIVGDVTKGLNVYPNMKLNASKVLKDAMDKSLKLEGHNYKFKLLRQDGTNEPSWKADGTFDMGDCIVAGEAPADQTDGNITFDSGKDYSSGQYVFYLVEEPVSGENEIDTKFDKTIYKIVVTVEDSPYKTDSLMAIPIKYYKVKEVAVCKKADTDNSFVSLDSESYSVAPSEDNTEATVTIGDRNTNPTFTNKIVPYTSTGSWTPKATKVVEGGEMKEFTLQLATDVNFQKIIQEAKTTGDKKKQTLSFVDASGKGIEYSLSDITANPDTAGDSTGRGASKTFTYYVREKTDGSLFSHYKYDKSVYKLTVVATDNTKGTINCKVTYRKGTVGSDGKWKNADSADHELTDTDTPTFTNTYSTSLPLSGMSGVTLTYLAGAAVLCAAAAWMHIRRKANARGGERRE